MEKHALYSVFLTGKEILLAISAINTYAIDCEAEHPSITAALDIIIAKIKNAQISDIGGFQTEEIPSSNLQWRTRVNATVKKPTAYAESLKKMSEEEKQRLFKKAVERYRKAEIAETGEQYWFNRIVDHFDGNAFAAMTYLTKN